tara:strand:- start:237 stop:1088 length:852 start_codon:yes stop_codon:yes gene_type:complete
MNQIINGDSEGWSSDALAISKLTNIGLIAKAALDAVPEPFKWSEQTKAQEKGSAAYGAYVGAVKGRLVGMEALRLIHTPDIAKEIFGFRGVANQLKQKGKAFFGIKTRKTDGSLDLSNKKDKELFVGELRNYLRNYFQKLIPISLGEAQSANSISNRDVEFLANAYMEAGALGDGFWGFAFVNEALLSQKIVEGMNTFVDVERKSIKEFETTYSSLLGLRQKNLLPATELLGAYTITKDGKTTMRTLKDEEKMRKMVKDQISATQKFLEFDSENNIYRIISEQ